MTHAVAARGQMVKIFCHIYCCNGLGSLVLNLSIVEFVTSTKAAVLYLDYSQSPNVTQSDTNQLASVTF